MLFFESNPYNLAAACLCAFVDWWRVSLWLICFGVFVVIIGVQKDRRAVVKVQAEEDAIVVTQLVGGKGKGRSDARSQGIAPGLSLNVRIKGQNGQRRKECLLVL